MSNRTKIALIIAAGFAAIVLIIIFIALGNRDKTAEKAANVKEGALIAVETPVVSPLPEKEKQAFSAQSLALAFVERFGSFSNQSNFLNFKELFSTMTETMSVWVEKTYLPKLKKEYPAAGFFYSISTKTGTAEIIEQKDDSMKIKITAVRKETREGKGEQEFLQDIILELKKKNNNWLIDGAYWGAKK